MRHSPPWLEVQLCTYILLLYGLIIIVFWFLKRKTTWVVNNFLVFVLKINDSVMKTVRNFYRRKEQPLWKPSFRLKRNSSVVKTFCCMFYFWREITLSLNSSFYLFIFYMISSCNPLIIESKLTSVKKPLLFFCYVNINNIVVKTLHFNFF